MLNAFGLPGLAVASGLGGEGSGGCVRGQLWARYKIFSGFATCEATCTYHVYY